MKRRGEKNWTNQRLRKLKIKKKVGLETKFFLQVVGGGWRVDSKGDGRDGGWIRMRLETNRVGQLDQRRGGMKHFNKCGVGREDGKGAVQTCEKDGQRW